jgi:hypothetical protein
MTSGSGMEEVQIPSMGQSSSKDNSMASKIVEDLEIFKLLLSGWGVIELRLKAIAQYKDRKYADNLVKQAQQKRKDFSKAQPMLSAVDLDYLFMHEVHGLIDAELVELGEKFYLPALRDLWKGKVSAKVLQANF